MANVKIPELVAKTSTVVDDLLLLVDSADSNKEKKVKMGDLSIADFIKDVSITTASSPNLEFKSTETAADDNEVGKIDFTGKSGSDDFTYAQILSLSDDESQKDGKLDIKIANNGVIDDAVTFSGFGTSTRATFYSNIILNSSSIAPSFQSAADLSFPYSNTMQYQSVGTDAPFPLQVVLDTPLVNAQGDSHIGSYDMGVDGDVYGRLKVDADDTTVDSEDGIITFQTITNGTLTTNMTLGNSGANYSALPLRIGADASSNELNDYEEGTWTPSAVAFLGDGGETDFENITATYVKIGKLVTLSAEFEVPANDDTSRIEMTGVPFTPKFRFSGSGTVSYFGSGNSLLTSSCVLDTGPSSIEVYNDSGTVAYDDIAKLSNAFFRTVRLTITYEI